MTKQQRITLSASRDIPFNKLMLSQSNLRYVKAGVSIEELAEDIAQRTLLSSITVRPMLDDNGAKTGMYTIPASGRRFRALELLVSSRRMNKTALVPCIVRTDCLASSEPTGSPRKTASPRTFSARRCIRSTSSARFRRCARRATSRNSECCHSFNGSKVPLSGL